MEEKEFAPSKKKLKKARKEGKVARSTELALGLLMLLFFLLLYLVGPTLYRCLKQLFSFQIMSQENPLEALWPILPPLLTIMLALFLFAYLVHVMQIGFLWSWPKRGKKNFRIVMPVLKLVGLLGIFTILYKTLHLPHCLNCEQLLECWANNLFFGGLALSLYLVVLGIFDLIYQKWRFLKQMRMTRSEKKEEERNH